jgi:hypothetical protein
VGVKWVLKRLWRFSHALTLGCLWVAMLSWIRWISRSLTAITQHLGRELGYEGTGVTGIGWKDCTCHKPAILYRIDGGRHQTPGRRAFLPFFLGRSNSDFQAAKAIMTAFEREEKGGWESGRVSLGPSR